MHTGYESHECFPLETGASKINIKDYTPEFCQREFWFDEASCLSPSTYLSAIINLSARNGDPGIYVVEMLRRQLLAAMAEKKAEDAGLKKRMRIFIEAVVKMVCPVFLAACVSLAKLDMEDQPNARDSLSILAGLILASGILSVLPLTFPNWFPNKFLVYEFSMFCIHLSGVLLMILAYLTLYLVMEEYVPLLVLVGVFATYTINCARETITSGHDGRATAVYTKFLDDLENSVDLSAAITFLLFSGLEGLVLGGQYTTIQMRKDCLPEVDKKMLLLLFHTIWLSFLVFIAGVLFMLVCMVPPVSNGDSVAICDILHVINHCFGCALAFIVLLITHGKLDDWVKSGFAITLSIIPFTAWPILHYTQGGGIGTEDEEVKPASLDLTKVTFTGFLAISIYTISENRKYSSWFIFFAAIAVNNSLAWRLLTHDKKPSAARFRAANVASLCAHIYITVAAVLFAFMARDALRKITSTTAPSPAPSPSCP